MKTPHFILRFIFLTQPAYSQEKTGNRVPINPSVIEETSIASSGKRIMEYVPSGNIRLSGIIDANMYNRYLTRA
ncbi:MAG: hypothetical protein LUF04_07685 [Bacteroides sp.]|nr:hypothetical protein [Bacteroides sp.]